MPDTGQYRPGLVRVPAETQLPTDWQRFLNWGESSKRLFTLHKDITLTQQRGGRNPEHLAGVSLSLPCLRNTFKTLVIAGVCPLGSKTCTFPSHP
jgi:hypothetical protein